MNAAHPSSTRLQDPRAKASATKARAPTKLHGPNGRRLRLLLDPVHSLNVSTYARRSPSPVGGIFLLPFLSLGHRTIPKSNFATSPPNSAGTGDSPLYPTLIYLTPPGWVWHPDCGTFWRCLSAVSLVLVVGNCPPLRTMFSSRLPQYLGESRSASI